MISELNVNHCTRDVSPSSQTKPSRRDTWILNSLFGKYVKGSPIWKCYKIKGFFLSFLYVTIWTQPEILWFLIRLCPVWSIISFNLGFFRLVHLNLSDVNMCKYDCWHFFPHTLSFTSSSRSHLQIWLYKKKKIVSILHLCKRINNNFGLLPWCLPNHSHIAHYP